jgi:hypothetical protein
VASCVGDAFFIEQTATRSRVGKQLDQLMIRVVSDQLPHSNTSPRLQALFHSLCRVLCTVRSLYFCTIGFSGNIEAWQVSNCQRVHAVLSNRATPGSSAHSVVFSCHPSSSGTGLSPCVTSTKFQAKALRDTGIETTPVVHRPCSANTPRHFLRKCGVVRGTCRWFREGHILRPRRSHRPRPSRLSSIPLQTDMLKFSR